MEFKFSLSHLRSIYIAISIICLSNVLLILQLFIKFDKYSYLVVIAILSLAILISIIAALACNKKNMTTYLKITEHTIDIYDLYTKKINTLNIKDIKDINCGNILNKKINITTLSNKKYQINKGFIDNYKLVDFEKCVLKIKP